MATRSSYKRGKGSGNIAELLGSQMPPGVLPKDASQKEWLQRSQALWQMLDELAESDPAAYKSFLSKVQQESRIVQSGLTLAFPKEREGIFINICQSQALKAPSSLSLNQADVPVLVSPSRPFKPGSDNRLVFDVVYHNSVLEECLRNPPYLKAIVELSLDCLDELYQIKLKGCHYDLTKESYVGPYAWDAKGQPLTEFPTAPLPEPEPSITIDSVLDFVKKQKEPESEEAVSEAITDLRLTSLGGTNIAKKDTDETSETRNMPLIQEIAMTPRHKVLRQNGEITLFVELPNVTRQSDVTCTISPNRDQFSLQGCGYEMKLDFSRGELGSLVSAQFRRGSRVLKVTYQSSQSDS